LTLRAKKSATWNALLAAVTAGVLSGCGCDQTFQSEEKSLSSDRIATVSTMDCGGALGGASTHVHIRNSNRPFSFREGLVLTVDAKVLVTIRWKDNQSLVVCGPKKLFKHDFVDNRIKAQKSEVDGVQIDYQEL
jgi:hypothetical protein